MSRIGRPLLAALLLSSMTGPAAADPGAPRALWADPPADPAHPAQTLAIEIDSHGAFLNAIVYLPSGPGPFPLVVLAHGLPGNEQNLDLAQTLRRAGWAVLTYHYRGAFGSEGAFSIDHSLEDMDAVLARAHAPGIAAAWHIDPARIVVMGHSLGGLAAAHASAGAPDRLATVLIAPWDPSVLQGLMAPLGVAERDRMALDRWSDVSHGRLAGTTASALAATIVQGGDRWRLADSAPALARRPLLIVLATRDLPSSRATRLLAALAAAGAPAPRLVDIDSNHVFDDHRVALQAAILQWLATLQGAPAAP